ncbi:hypothetical protein Misp04_45690 [Micromonospora sp. NBRC 101691]|nr:hypothetical protein Misp04_45690 [Micromonospora sp. NBRC 101691]
MTSKQSWPSLEFLSENLVLPPADAPDVCPQCRTAKRASESVCENCEQIALELSFPCKIVIPISLYCKPSVLRDWLKYYKPQTDGFEPEYGRYVQGILRGYFDHSGPELRRLIGDWDVVTVVPSTVRRPPHPLELLANGSVDFGAPMQRLLCRTASEIGHRSPNDEAFEVTANVVGLRILILDDVYTTGARSQSAASVLHKSGAVVPAIVPVGRRINPGYSEATERVWRRQAALGFSFEQQFWRQ